MSDWPTGKEPGPPGPISVQHKGAPIEPQTQQIFGSFVHSKVVGIIVEGVHIHVTYANGTKMVFTPTVLP